MDSLGNTFNVQHCFLLQMNTNDETRMSKLDNSVKRQIMFNATLQKFITGL